MALGRDDVRYMPETYAAEVETLPTSIHAILWVAALFILSAIIWANFATVDQMTHAQGQVIPSSQLQTVQNLEGGILSEVLIKEGDRVKKGQTLMRLDPTRFASSYDESQFGAYALMADIARLKAEIANKPFTAPEGFPASHINLIDNERQLYAARQQELKSSLEILNQQVAQQKQALAELQSKENKLQRNADLARQQLAMTEPLVKTGAVSRVDLLHLKVQVNDSQGELDSVRLSIPKARAAIAEAEEKVSEKIQQFHREAQSDLNDAQTKLSRLTISNVALKDRVTRTDVRSPVDGTIKQIMVTTRGAVIQPGMDLVSIVPSDDTLLVEAKVRPRDIAFIHPGQQATVKLTAYDFSIYGGLDAVLELISADTISDDRGNRYFKIQVRTRKNHLGTDANPLPIIPGMIATVDIKTGEKTVMDYLLKPLKRAEANAMTER